MDNPTYFRTLGCAALASIGIAAAAVMLKVVVVNIKNMTV